MPELTLIQIDKTEFERLYQQAHGGSKSAAREIDALCSGNESSACFLCNESLGNDPVFHQVMPEFGDINKLIAAPLCPVCRTLPKMVRTNRCISLLQKMYAARSGKNIRFGAPSRRPVIPAKAAANVSAVRSHQNLTAPLVGVPRQGPQSVIRIGGDIRKMWCVAMLRPNSTYIAVTNLVRQGYRSFCPVFQGTTKIVRNRLVSVDEPVFPNYLFIELENDQRWVPVNHTIGVARLLTRQSSKSEYYEPCLIADDFVQRLKSCSYCVVKHDTSVFRLAVGTRVRITQGPFVAYEGVISSSSSENRVRLVLWMLNRQVSVVVSEGDLEPIT